MERAGGPPRISPADLPEWSARGMKAGAATGARDERARLPQDAASGSATLASFYVNSTVR